MLPPASAYPELTGSVMPGGLELPSNPTGALGEPGRQSAADGEGGVAVGHQRRDERLAVDLAELEDLEAADDKVAFTVRLIGRERGLPVAGAGPQVHPVRPGGREDGVRDERRHRLAAVEP